MADGFIIKRGNLGGTKQVDSVKTDGIIFSLLILNEALEGGEIYESQSE